MNENEPWCVDLYPVGLLADWLFLARTIRRASCHTPDAWRKLRYNWRHGRRQRGYWNGYIAESALLGVRAGHGWTKARARRSLERSLREADTFPPDLFDPQNWPGL